MCLVFLLPFTVDAVGVHTLLYPACPVLKADFAFRPPARELESPRPESPSSPKPGTVLSPAVSHQTYRLVTERRYTGLISVLAFPFLFLIFNDE